LWFENVIAMLVVVPDFRDIMQADCLHALHSRFPVLQTPVYCVLYLNRKVLILYLYIF